MAGEVMTGGVATMPGGGGGARPGGGASDAGLAGSGPCPADDGGRVTPVMASSCRSRCRMSSAVVTSPLPGGGTGEGCGAGGLGAARGGGPRDTDGTASGASASSGNPDSGVPTNAVAAVGAVAGRDAVAAATGPSCRAATGPYPDVARPGVRASTTRPPPAGEPAVVGVVRDTTRRDPGAGGDGTAEGRAAAAAQRALPGDDGTVAGLTGLRNDGSEAGSGR